MNNSLYEKLAIGTRYFQFGEKLAERVEQEEEKLKAIKREFANVKNEKIGFSEVLIPICKGALIISSVILGLAIFLILFDLAVFKDGDGILFVILPIAIVVSFLGGHISKRKLRRAERESEEIYQTVYKQKIQEQEKEVTEITEATKKYVQENYHVVEFLPVDYRDLQAISYMLLCVINGRAETMKEAINLYETQLHRWRLESLAEQSVEAQEYLALAMNELNARQAETNAHLAAIEYMKYVEYFKNSSNQ